MTSAHEILNPETLAQPVGFSHAVVAAPGRMVFLGGQVGHDADGQIVSPDIAEQFSRAAANVVEALTAAGGSVEDLVSMQIYVTDVASYRAALSDLGTAYQQHLGRHYPAIALFEVSGLFDPAARVELVCVAVIPDQR